MDGNITEANDVFLKMVGYTRAELLAGSISWKDMTPQEYAHLDMKALDEMKEFGAVSTPFEKEYIRKDRSRVPIILGGAFLDPAQREGVSFILDITERKGLEQRKDDFINKESAHAPVACFYQRIETIGEKTKGNNAEQYRAQRLQQKLF